MWRQWHTISLPALSYHVRHEDARGLSLVPAGLEAVRQTLRPIRRPRRSVRLHRGRVQLSLNARHLLFYTCIRVAGKKA